LTAIGGIPDPGDADTHPDRHPRRHRNQARDQRSCRTRPGLRAAQAARPLRPQDACGARRRAAPHPDRAARLRRARSPIHFAGPGRSRAGVGVPRRGGGAAPKRAATGVPGTARAGQGGCAV